MITESPLTIIYWSQTQIEKHLTQTYGNKYTRMKAEAEEFNKNRKKRRKEMGRID